MWKDELVEILFSSDPSKLDIKKAINLKYMNTPSSLYKYRSFDDGHSLELLKTDKMRLSRPDSFNDPFDCALKLKVNDSPKYIGDILADVQNLDYFRKYNIKQKELNKAKRKLDPIHELLKVYYKKNYPNIKPEERNKLIEEEENKIKSHYLNLGLKDNIHLACFSETHKSTLMWSHYASNHKGFCIEYNFKELGLNNPFLRFIFPVIYTETIFDMKNYLPDSNKKFGNVLKRYMHPFNAEDILEGSKLPESKDNVNNMVLFYTALNKSSVWSYEKEWRYVFPYKNIINKTIHLPVPKPKAIYLGAMIDEKNSEKILKLGEKRNIDIYKMNIKPSEFALESKFLKRK